MRHRITIFAILGVLLVALAAWWYSPTQVLKRRCNRFFDVISFSEKVQGQARRLQAMKLGDYLDRNVALATKDLPEEISNPAPRDEVLAVFACVCDACSFVSITERKYDFIGVNGDTAIVHATVKVAIGHPEGDRGFNGTHQMMLSWHHFPEGWRLTEVSWNKLPPSAPKHAPASDD